MGDDKILRQNKIPGCDELTRPEEIKALNKFLRHIKDVQSEHTKLQKDNLEIPGRTTGKIPKISKLPNSSQTLDVRKARIDKLEGYSLNVPTNENDTGKIKLPNYREKLSDQRKVELSEYVEGLDDNRSNPELSNYKENIEDNRTNKLSEYKEGLEDDRRPELSNYRENIIDNRKASLSDYKEELKDNRSDIELENYRENLDDQRNPELSKYKETITDNRENKLSNYKENIEDNRINNLSNHKETLQDNRTVKLSDYKENLKDSRTNQLETYKEQLEDNRDIQLSEYKQTITDGRNISLSDYRKSITDSRENELSNHKENLVDDRTQELSTYKETITDSRDTKLSEYKESITDDRDISLSDKKESIVDSRNIELSTYKEEIADDRTTELSDYKENLSVTQENELSNYQESLISSSNPDSTITELEDGAEMIPGTITEQEQLEDYQEKLIESDNSNSTITELENYKETITDDRENELEDYKEQLTSSTNENSTVSELEDTRLDLSDFREELVSSTNSESTITELEDTRIDIDDERTNSLEDERIDLTDDRDNSLEDTRIDIVDDRENELEDYKEQLTSSTNENSTVSELEDTRLDDFIDSLDDDRENNLEDERIDIEGEIKDPNLYDESVRLETPEATNSDTYFDSTQEGNELYDAVLERPDSSNDGWFDPEVGGELYDAVLERPNDTSEKASSFDNLERFRDIRELTSTLSEDDLYNLAIEIAGELGDWGKKIQSLMSAYLSSSVITLDRANEYEEKLKQEIALQSAIRRIAIPDSENIKSGSSITKLPGEETLQTITAGSTKVNMPGTDSMNNDLSTNLNQVFNLSSLFTGINIGGGVRNALVGETLSFLLGDDDAEHWRLPGASNSIKGLLNEAKNRAIGAAGDILGGLANSSKGVLSSVLGSASGLASTYSEVAMRQDPINRPDGDVVTGWDEANNRTTTSGNSTGASSSTSTKEKSGLLKSLVNSVKSIGKSLLGSDKPYKFVTNYLTGKGINLTLSDLSLRKVEDIDSVDSLFNALRESPFITVSDKFTTTSHNGYVTTTLDSNSYWEIVLQPYCGPENGNFSFLPAIHEINTRNIALHSVNTAYSQWIPFISFDLQKSKITSKTLDLYDGSISYPTSMEFLNELRITIVDDQYKSWRTYFETCADVAIYNSEPHDSNYYWWNGSGELTAVDKSSVVISMYKNITFRCCIYVMTPQLSTIKKYDLLVLMRDFSEESSGDIDSGGMDLTVTFSIVGENPVKEIDKSIASVLNRATQKLDKSNMSMTSLIQGSVTGLWNTNSSQNTLDQIALLSL